MCSVLMAKAWVTPVAILKPETGAAKFQPTEGPLLIFHPAMHSRSSVGIIARVANEARLTAIPKRSETAPINIGPITPPSNWLPIGIKLEAMARYSLETDSCKWVTTLEKIPASTPTPSDQNMENWIRSSLLDGVSNESHINNGWRAAQRKATNNLPNGNLLFKKSPARPSNGPRATADKLHILAMMDAFSMLRSILRTRRVGVHRMIEELIIVDNPIIKYSRGKPGKRKR